MEVSPSYSSTLFDDTMSTLINPSPTYQLVSAAVTRLRFYCWHISADGPCILLQCFMDTCTLYYYFYLHT
jgi:hypothetical protein